MEDGRISDSQKDGEMDSGKERDQEEGRREDGRMGRRKWLTSEESTTQRWRLYVGSFGIEGCTQRMLFRTGGSVLNE